jgi:hypothetical protein
LRASRSPRNEGNRVKVTLLAILKDSLVSGLDLLEAGTGPAVRSAIQRAKSLRPVLLRDVVLGDVAVEVGWDDPRAASYSASGGAAPGFCRC